MPITTPPKRFWRKNFTSHSKTAAPFGKGHAFSSTTSDKSKARLALVLHALAIAFHKRKDSASRNDGNRGSQPTARSFALLTRLLVHPRLRCVLIAPRGGSGFLK